MKFFNSLKEVFDYAIFYKKYYFKYIFNFILVVILSILAMFADLVSVGAFISVIKVVLSSDVSADLIFFGIDFKWIRNLNLTNKEIILSASAVLIIVMALKEWLLYFNALVALKLRLLIDKKVKHDLFRKTLIVDYYNFNNIEKGNGLSIISGLSPSIGILVFNIIDSVPLFCLLLFNFCILLYVSWQATAFTALVLLFIIALNAWVLRSQKQISTEVMASNISQTEHIISMLGGGTINNVFNLSPKLNADFKRVVENNTRLTGLIGRLNIVVAPIQGMASIMGLAVVILTLGLNAPPNDTKWIETLMLFVFVLWRLMGPVIGLNTKYNTTIQLIPSLGKVKNFLEFTEKNQMDFRGQSFSGIKDDITLVDLEYKYPTRDMPVVKNINAVIRHGKVNALVGKSGSGKSTLALLLLRALTPTSGQILIGDTDTSNLSILDWFSHIAYVPQTPHLINGTIQENIILGNIDATLEEIIEVSKLTHIHEFIEQLPEKYSTYLGEGGLQLSGGQAQRLSIARALLKKPDVVILDEPTSAQDAETEYFLKDSLYKLFKGRTAIMIAHRLSTIQDADQILVMQDGSIIESGTHQYLLLQNNVYAGFVNNQKLNTIEDIAEE